MATSYPLDLTRDELAPNRAVRAGRVARIVARQLALLLDRPVALSWNDPAEYGPSQYYVSATEWTAFAIVMPPFLAPTRIDLDYLCCLRADVSGGTATLRLRHGANLSNEVAVTAGGGMHGPFRVRRDSTMRDAPIVVEAKTSSTSAKAFAWSTRTDLWHWWEDR